MSYELSEQDRFYAALIWQGCSGLLRPMVCHNESHGPLKPEIRLNKTVLTCSKCTWVQTWVPPEVETFYKILDDHGTEEFWNECFPGRITNSTGPSGGTPETAENSADCGKGLAEDQ